MKTTASSLAISSLALFMCGCAAFFPPAEKKDFEHGGYWLNYGAERRGAVILPKDDNYRYCAEPAPDVAQNMINKIQADVKDSASGSAESDINSIELAGRTYPVLIAREALYRLCELSLNQKLSSEEITKMFGATISMISNVVKADSDRSNAKAATAAVASKALSKDASPEQVRQLLEKIK